MLDTSTRVRVIRHMALLYEGLALSSPLLHYYITQGQPGFIIKKIILLHTLFSDNFFCHISTTSPATIGTKPRGDIPLK